MEPKAPVRAGAATERSGSDHSIWIGTATELEGGEMIRVLVVEDNLGFRDALVGLLQEQPDIEVVGTAGSLSETRAMFEAILDGIDVVLLDRGLPEGDGLELIGGLRAMNPGARVYVISSTAEIRHPQDAIEAGADGVIDKIETPEQVFSAIRDSTGG